MEPPPHDSGIWVGVLALGIALLLNGIRLVYILAISFDTADPWSLSNAELVPPAAFIFAGAVVTAVAVLGRRK